MPDELEARLDEVTALLGEYASKSEGLSLREKVIRLARVLQGVRAVNVAAVRADGCDARGGKERIRLYLVHHVNQVIDGVELEVVSGISEYARRVRELRVEEGYRILTGASNDPDAGVNLRTDQYLLLRAEPDASAAERWAIANSIRRTPGLSARERILRFLKANVNRVVTSEELAYAAGDVSEWARRTRELRTEHGYAVATYFTGRPDLRPGEYVLESLERVAEPHDRHIAMEVQQAVYRRDSNTCRICRWERSQWSRQDPRFLELHHVEHHSAGGVNTEANLIVVCNVCHDGVHAGRLQPPPP